MDVNIDHVATHIDGDPVKTRKYVHQFRNKPFLSGNVFKCLRGTYLPEIPKIKGLIFFLSFFLPMCLAFKWWKENFSVKALRQNNSFLVECNYPFVYFVPV